MVTKEKSGTESRLSRFLGRITKSDKTIFKFFFIMLGIIFTIILINETINWHGSYAAVVVSILNGSMIVFLLTGILTLYYTRKSIISTKKIFIWFIISALIIAIVITIIFYLLLSLTDILDGYFTINQKDNFNVYLIFWVFTYLFLGIFVMQLLLFLMGFGVNGILTAVERGVGPETMLFISRISHKTSKSMKKKEPRLYLRYHTLRWRFNIPNNLNTKPLTVSKVKPRSQFPWKQFKSAIIWENLFGIVLSINISLNPLLLNEISIEELFATSSFIGAFILILIFPFLIYNRINAIIGGVKKPFKLEAGLRNRTFQIIAGVGTLIFLIRFILQDFILETVILSFFIFFLAYLAISIILTFIYYNYFEDDLARDIANRYFEVKE
ncbi:MAG: hypothetical protein ACW964_16385 [Candidatus Hodarchaeales archaeon]